jgi:hypothetical protein
MPNLSDIIRIGGDLQFATVALTGDTSSQLIIPGSNVLYRIPFNALSDPFSFCTINPSLSTFSLLAGTYSIEVCQGAAYASAFGGSFGAAYRLAVGNNVHFYKKYFENNAETDFAAVGAPYVVKLNTTSTCTLDFIAPRPGPSTFQQPGYGGTVYTAPGTLEWFKCNIVKLA